MDDPFNMFRGSSFFQFSCTHKIQKKTFSVIVMTYKNLFNLPRRKILTKIRHLKNLFLEAVEILPTSMFLVTQDLESFKRQIPANSLSFFVTLQSFSFGSFPCSFIQTLNVKHVIGCAIDCVRSIKTLIVCEMFFQKYEICFFLFTKLASFGIYSNLHISIFSVWSL